MSLYACCDHCSMRGPHKAHTSPCAATCSEGGEPASNPPSSPVEATAGSVRPSDYLRGYRDGLNAILDAIKRDPLSDAPTAPMCRKHPDHRLQAADDRRAL